MNRCRRGGVCLCVCVCVCVCVYGLGGGTHVYQCLYAYVWVVEEDDV